MILENLFFKNSFKVYSLFNNNAPLNIKNIGTPINPISFKSIGIASFKLEVVNLYTPST